MSDPTKKRRNRVKKSTRIACSVPEETVRQIEELRSILCINQSAIVAQSVAKLYKEETSPT